MINVNELRLGNIVDVVTAGPDIGKPVTGITERSVHFGDGDEFDLKYVEPVELTPEILEKAGFENGGVVDADGDDIYFWSIQKPNGEALYLNDDFQPEDSGFPVIDYKLKYLHQLQNLYFALTGEDLKIEL